MSTSTAPTPDATHPGEGGADAAAAALPARRGAIPAATVDAAALADERERALVLWLSNASHALNHFQSQMVSVLYPVIMAELGFGYAQLGMLTAIRNLLGNGMQMIYGFLAPFISRSRLLGIGNVGLGIGTLLTGVAGSFPAFVGARVVSSVASSAQHPVGYSLLAGYFPKSRGAILALNTSLASVGSLLAPPIAALLLVVLGWRQIFYVVAGASVVMGLVYFLLHDRVGGPGAQAGSGRQRLARGKESYGRVLRNRNVLVISLVMMAGAAGRGDGVNATYLGPHLVNDLALSVVVAGFVLAALQVGNIAGPLGFGWLSDRVSRKGVLQLSLLLSALATWWLAHQGAYLPVLVLNMVVYGAVTGSRNTLTQALIADSLADEDRDAAFSVYYFLGFLSGPVWALLTGFIMENYGFSLAFSVLTVSYVLGMALMFLIQEPRGTHSVARG
ncbi:MAG TPA: MFS transporter [Chloroflexota bacterium]|jgi:MFS family permease